MLLKGLDVGVQHGNVGFKVGDFSLRSDSVATVSITTFCFINLNRSSSKGVTLTVYLCVYSTIFTCVDYVMELEI